MGMWRRRHLVVVVLAQAQDRPSPSSPGRSRSPAKLSSSFHLSVRGLRIFSRLSTRKAPNKASTRHPIFNAIHLLIISHWEGYRELVRCHWTCDCPIAHRRTRQLRRVKSSHPASSPTNKTLSGPRILKDIDIHQRIPTITLQASSTT